MFKRKQACVDCHFFIKAAPSLSSPNVHPYSATSEERKRAATADFSWAKDNLMLSCHLGVWDEGLGSNKNAQKETIVDKNRRGFCFFWPYQPGMLIPAGKVLQEREAQTRAASHDRRLTIIGLFIAAIALMANVVVTVGLKVAEQLHWWPFPQK